MDAASSDGTGYRVTPEGIELIERLGLRNDPT